MGVDFVGHRRRSRVRSSPAFHFGTQRTDNRKRHAGTLSSAPQTGARGGRKPHRLQFRDAASAQISPPPFRSPRIAKCSSWRMANARPPTVRELIWRIEALGFDLLTLALRAMPVDT